LVLVLSLVTGVLAASGPNLVQNGDFASGFSNWSIFQTPNGVTNEAVEFDMDPRLASLHVSQITPQQDSWEGGGIRQTFNAPAGSWEASFYYCATRGSNLPYSGYIPGPKFELLVDGVVVTSVITPNIDSSSWWDGTLSATGSFTAGGSHEMSIRVTYNHVCLPGWKTEYIGNIKLSMTSINAQIDIKPGDSINSINLESKGVVPLAILGSAHFDASTVDPATISLEGAQARLKGKSRNYGSLQDVNGDGYPDLVVQVNTQDLGLTAGSSTATLTAYTFGGVPVSGSDSINILP